MIVILNIKYCPVRICIAIGGWGTYNPKQSPNQKYDIYYVQNYFGKLYSFLINNAKIITINNK